MLRNFVLQTLLKYLIWKTYCQFSVAQGTSCNLPSPLPRHKGQAVTYLYRVEIFCGVIDLISGEMSSRFTERNTELLLCIGSLDPSNSFSSFDHEKLLQLAQFYPEDFLRLTESR